MSGNRPTTTADPFKNGSSGSLRYKLGFRSNNNSSAATPLPQSNTSTLPVPAPEITNNLYSTIDQVSTPPVIMNNSTKSSPLRAGVGVGAGGGGMEASLASKSGVHGVGGIPSSSSMNSISGMLSPSSVRKFLGKRIDNNSKSSIVKKPVASSPLTADPESRGGGTMTRNNSSGSTPLSALLSIHGQQFAINNMATTTGGFDPPPTPVSVFPRNMSSSLPTSSIMDSIGRDGGGDGLDFNFSNNFDNSLVSESSDTQHNQSSSNTFGHTLHDMMFGKAATQRSASLNNSTSPSPSSSPLRRTPNRPSPKSYENYNEDQSPSYNIPHNYLNEPNDVSALLGIGDPASVMKNNNSLYKNSQFSSSLPDVGQLDQPSSYTYKEEVDIDSLILMVGLVFLKHVIP